MKTWQQTTIKATPFAATLALATALAFGGAAGYAVRAFAQSQDAISASTTETHRIVNPGLGLRRAEVEDRDSPPAGSIPDASGMGPVAGHNPGIGLHQLDREDLP